MAHNSIICYQNIADTPGLVVTTPGTIVAGSMSSLFTRQLSDKVRIDCSAIGNEIVLKIDMNAYNGGGLWSTDIVALLGLNIGTAVDITVSTSTDGVVWTGVPGFKYAVGGYTLADAGLRTQTPTHVVVDISGNNLWRYLQIICQYIAVGDIFDIGRLWIGPTVPLGDGVDGTWSMTANDAGLLKNSKGQQWYEEAGIKTRVLTMPLTGISGEATYGLNSTGASLGDVPSIQGLMVEAGLTGEVIAVANMSSPPWIRRSGVYGHLATMPNIIRGPGNQFDTSITVIEER